MPFRRLKLNHDALRRQFDAMFIALRERQIRVDAALVTRSPSIGVTPCVTRPRSKP
jgi:hypothetical protein